MIITGPKIVQEVEAGNIEIDPWIPEHANPASVDLTLGDKVRVYKPFSVDLCTGPTPHASNYTGSTLRPSSWSSTADARLPIETEEFIIRPEHGWVLNPGVCYLMHTVERVKTDKYVPVLDGKSSIGRLFIQVHITAGFGDPGFDGQYTLEVVSHFPIRVYPGMRFCQMRFHCMEGPVMSYQDTGRYVGKAAEGPIPSLLHRDK